MLRRNVVFHEFEMPVLRRHDSDRNEAFVELLSLHQRKLYGFIYTLVPNRADAEDLLQQTSLVLWQKFDEFDLNSSFPAWACRIAHGKVLHHLREKRRSRVVFDDDVVARLAKSRQSREEIHLSDWGVLTRCIEELSGTDRRLLELCYAATRNIKAAAAALERPVESVYVSLVRIRRLLMDCLRRTNVEEAQK
jgi:RNA polymerase sigma-70 factor, ECF subfamily